MADRIGQQLGNYRLTRLLGPGGFADVYLGEHIYLGTTLAIKVLHTHMGPEEIAQFQQEARLLVGLRHPHIVSIVDFGIQEQTPYLMMDYAQRGSLRTCHPRGTLVPVATVVEYLRQATQALQYAHDKDIVHRDLKPENILLNDKEEVLLADFGIAVVLDKTQRVDRTGTPAYMAPEQFDGDVSKKSDQYALGCIAYELLTGQRPFTASDYSGWKQKHLNDQPLPPTQLNPHIPLHMEQALLKALAKRREDRYPDIDQFMKAFSTSPKTKEQWYDEGRVHYDAKRYEEALVAFEQAILLEPNSAPSYYHKGMTLDQLNRQEEALEACEWAIFLDPTIAHYYVYKAWALHSLGHHTVALAVYKQALERDPNDGWIHHSLGTVLLKLKRYEEALINFEQCIRLNPGYPYAYMGKCDSLYQLKRYEAALGAIEQYLQLAPNDDPWYVHGYNHKGNALTGLGRSEEAKLAFEKAKQLGS